jgi:hypothetical protein
VTDYTTTALVKASLGITDTNDDAKIAAAVTAASRAIDLATGTAFGVSTTTSSRTYWPESSYEVWVDRFDSTTGLVVKTGTDGSTWTAVTSTDVVSWPTNAPSKGGAYCRLLIPTGALPTGYLRPTVQVTAAWGFAATPEPVSQAALIKAARIFRRKDSPDGIAGQSEFGVVRISRSEDPDVLALLAPYMDVGFA